MNWQTFQAQQVQRAIDGESVIDIEQEVLASLRTVAGACKREDLCSMVAARTGIFLYDVSANLSTILKRMKGNGQVYSPTRGYWCINVRH